MVRANRYDLILMDVQMPVMDGLQATAAIRQMHDLDQLPIIALTANAFDEDRRKCLNAGMNNHLAKPISPEKLYNILATWLPSTGQYQELPNQPNSPGHGLTSTGSLGQSNVKSIGQVSGLDSESSVNPEILARLAQAEGLDITAGLQILQGNQERYIRVLGQFISLYEDIAESITTSLARNDLKFIQHSAHALKGAAGTLGAKAIQELAGELEKLAKTSSDNTDPELDLQIGLLATAISQLTSHYYRAVAGSAGTRQAGDPFPGEVSAEDRSKAREVLLHLRALLVVNDAEATGMVEESRQLLQRVIGDSAAKLENQILNFDFRDALNTLDQLAKQV